jgi:hypothetical protein
MPGLPVAVHRGYRRFAVIPSLIGRKAAEILIGQPMLPARHGNV